MAFRLSDYLINIKLQCCAPVTYRVQESLRFSNKINNVGRSL